MRYAKRNLVPVPNDMIQMSFEDVPRLRRQVDRVLAALQDGRWWTIPQLAGAARSSHCSASARIRDLRKIEYGGHTIETRRVKNRPGVVEYHLLKL